MKTKIFLILLLTAQVIFISCENGVEDNTTPRRRDYTWTITELNSGEESLYLRGIWGGSANDVWAVGSSSWTGTSIWHYDGEQWRCDSTSRNVNPVGIYGASDTEIWLGNLNSTIWRYRWSQWQMYAKLSLDGYDLIDVNDFCGKDAEDIYAVGFADNYAKGISKGIMLHYNGIEWNFINIPDTKASLESVEIENNSNVLVVSGTNYDPSGFVPKIYCWDGKELKDLSISGSGDTYVKKLGNEIYVSTGSQIYKYSNKHLTLWQDNTNTAINGRLWCGRSKNDFFMEGANGIYHYNGTDFTQLYQINYKIFFGTIFEKDVFFIAYDNPTGKNYIIHGKLN